MKDQARIQFRTRKVAKVNAPEIDKNVKSLKDVDQPVNAFKPYEVINLIKPQSTTSRRSSRLAENKKQTVLSFKADDKNELDDDKKNKRKPKHVQNESNKKLKKNHETKETNLNEIVTEKEETNLKETVTETKETIVEKEETIIKETIVEKEETIVKETIVEKEETNVKEIQNEKVDLKENETSIIKEKSTLQIVDEDIKHEAQDSPSPPSTNYLEPLTPPVHLTSEPTHHEAPFKTYLTEADKQRIEYEKTTLERLRKALDIVITERSARNRPCLYHLVESALRNSTRRNITLSHICQIMYISPKLYTLEAKELRNYGGKVTEAYLIEFGKQWEIPLTGKDLQDRSDQLKDALVDYFTQHPEHDATIPQIPLPRLNIVIDKKEWLQDAKLPPGVRSLLEAHEKAKEAEVEREKPKPKPTGSVKDRMAALRARLAEKKKPSS